MLASPYMVQDRTKELSEALEEALSREAAAEQKAASEEDARLKHLADAEVLTATCGLVHDDSDDDGRDNHGILLAALDGNDMNNAKTDHDDESIDPDKPTMVTLLCDLQSAKGEKHQVADQLRASQVAL